MKKRITMLVALLALAGSLLAVSSVSALDIGTACTSLPDSEVCKSKTDNISSQNGFVKTITDILLFLLGTAAVIAIIIGGVKYATSNGDASQVQSAKNTIMYAVIGLIVAIMAWGIVSFVTSRFASTGVNQTSSGSAQSGSSSSGSGSQAGGGNAVASACGAIGGQIRNDRCYHPCESDDSCSDDIRDRYQSACQSSGGSRIECIAASPAP